MNDQDLQRLVSTMTNFYNEAMPSDPSLVRFWGVIGKVFEVLYREYRSTRNNTFLESAETLRTIPYFKLDATNGLYEMRLANELIQRTHQEQINFLRENQWYIQLEFSDDVLRKSVVYAMRLQQSFNSERELEVYNDYFIYGNRIYLLPRFIIQKRNNSRTLHAFDIKIDDQRLERNWGSLLGIETGLLIPRYEYKAILQVLDRILAEGATMRQIKSAIQTVPAWSEFNMWDIRSRTLPDSIKRLYDDWKISPSHIVAKLPDAALLDEVRMEILTRILDEVRAPETRFIFFGDINKAEGDEHEDSLFPYYSPLPYVTVSADDTPEGEALAYYPEMEVDGDAQEYFEVQLHSYPEIPREFTVSPTGIPGEIKLSWSPKTEGASYFELFGTDVLTNEFELLETIPNDEEALEISVIYDKNVVDQRHFKVRSVCEVFTTLVESEKRSLFTLPVDATII